MAKRAGAYRSEKRKKEVKRQKKQEEKRLRRLGLLRPAEETEHPEAHDQEAPGTDVAQSEGPEEGSDAETGEEQGT